MKILRGTIRIPSMGTLVIKGRLSKLVLLQKQETEDSWEEEFEYIYKEL